MFVAITLPGNHRMIGVFRDSGFPVEVRAHPGELHIRFPTSLTPEGRRRFEARERDAAVAAVAHVLRPVVGAARRRRGGARAPPAERRLRNLAGAASRGRCTPCWPRARLPPASRRRAASRTCPGTSSSPCSRWRPTASCRPRASAPGAATCGRSSCCWRAAAAVDTAQLVATCRARRDAAGRAALPRRVNTDPAIALDATFAPARPAARSGRVRLAERRLRDRRARPWPPQRGVGLSSFVSMGAKADLSGNDLLQFWEADSGTDVVLLYLESFGNPRRFGQVARRVTARKPVIAVKSGRAPARRGPDSSQTGALLAASDTHVDALFRHAGRDPDRHARARCSTSPGCSHASRRRAATASRSSPTPAASACSARTRARPPACAWRRSGSRRSARWRRRCRPARRCPTRSTCPPGPAPPTTRAPSPASSRIRASTR